MRLRLSFTSQFLRAYVDHTVVRKYSNHFIAPELSFNHPQTGTSRTIDVDRRRKELASNGLE